MTHVFGETGEHTGVTVIEAGPCLVLAVKEKSVQVGFEPAKESRLSKPLAGFFKKINVTPQKVIAELSKDQGREYKVGEELRADLFKVGDYVDISGTSIGKGFQGGMKRWHWRGGDATHGSTSHRRVGSLGSTTTPGRVWKGHHLPGHMGAIKVTVQNMEIVKVDAENNCILVKGAIPGHENNYVVIRTAKKKGSKTKQQLKQKTTKETKK